MAGTHSKDLLTDVKLAISKLINRKAINKLEVFKAVVIVMTAGILISSLITALFFADNAEHQKMVKGTKEVIKMSGSMETAIITLRQENKDISAWLTIEGTNIDYAVCTADDDYYKNHNQQHNRSRYGALYMTDGDVPQRVKGDRNLVIYGNNMADGSMFGMLDEYRKLRFFKKNPCFSFQFGNIKQYYCVFAVAVIDGENPDFDYKKSYFSSQAEFYEWHKKIAERSIIDTTDAPEMDDRLLPLVTDTHEFEGAKLVVMARLVEGLESKNINTESAKVNSTVIYPQKWYNR